MRWTLAAQPFAPGFSLTTWMTCRPAPPAFPGLSDMPPWCPLTCRWASLTEFLVPLYLTHVQGCVSWAPTSHPCTWEASPHSTWGLGSPGSPRGPAASLRRHGSSWPGPLGSAPSTKDAVCAPSPAWGRQDLSLTPSATEAAVTPHRQPEAPALVSVSVNSVSCDRKGERQCPASLASVGVGGSAL